MATPVILPKQGNSVETCILNSWLKQPGDSVAEGEAICEVETDKTSVEITSPVAGTLIEQFFGEDDDVPVMTYIAAVGEAGEDVSEFRPEGGNSPAQATDADSAQPAQGIADAVTEAPATSPEPALAPAPVPAGPAAGAAGSSPRARALAAERGVAIASLTGSGPDGLVIERDVQAAAAAGPRLSPTARAAVAEGRAAPGQGTGPAGMVLAADLVAGRQTPAERPAGSVTDEPLRGIRKIIAERMRASLSESAQLTLNASARATALQAYRAQVKQHGERYGLPNITINDMIVFAVSRVLPRHPQVNAHFLGDKVRQFADVNIGVAVDTDKGLLVPVLPQANHKSLVELCEEFKPVAKACQAGKADPSRLQGGTFTVTNLGALGIEHFTPVLNVPEVAILGVGGLTTRPERQADGSVDFVDVIALSLTIDHQALDGAPAARFLQDLVTSLENFSLLLTEAGA